MRISRVEVERFLGFKAVSIDFDSSLQLIAGPNNAGKSTLVRLLEAFFSNPDGSSLGALRPLNEYYLKLGSRTLSSITVWFDTLTDEEAVTFAPLLRKDGQIWLRLRCSRSEKVSFQGSNKATSDDAKRLYLLAIESFRFVKIPSVRVGNVNGRDEPASLERLLDTLEAVLIRSGAARSTNLQQDFAAKMQPVESLVKAVLDESAEAISADLPFHEQDVRFELPDARHALRGMLESAAIRSADRVDLPIAERGTGFQSALVLGILRYVAEHDGNSAGNLMFAIEEPEAFLHPQTQRSMAKVINDISATAQLLVTTHSSVLVDSFPISRIARLPLQPGGLTHKWNRPRLEKAEAGRLSRYCDATNSELIFANAVVLVEGQGDFGVIERLLSGHCGTSGGHYGLGITVIECGGLGTMKHLAGLADHFGVRAYLLADKDGLRKRNGKRVFIDLLTGRATRPEPATVDALRAEADNHIANLQDALASAGRYNSLLNSFDAFVLPSDLEGLVHDTYGTTDLAEHLGPSGLGLVDAAAVTGFTGIGGSERLLAWLGSKGWNCDIKPTKKLDPHMPQELIATWLEAHTTSGSALAPLDDWLKTIIEAHTPTPL